MLMRVLTLIQTRGRLLTRISDDTDELDLVLPFAFRSFIVSSVDCVIDFIVITALTPVVSVLWPIIAVVYFYTQVPLLECPRV